MKIIVNQLFEQGLARQNGGMLKMSPGAYDVEPTEGGLLVRSLKRTIPNEVIENLKGLGLISVE